MRSIRARRSCYYQARCSCRPGFSTRSVGTVTREPHERADSGPVRLRVCISNKLAGEADAGCLDTALNIAGAEYRMCPWRLHPFSFNAHHNRLGRGDRSSVVLVVDTLIMDVVWAKRRVSQSPPPRAQGGAGRCVVLLSPPPPHPAGEPPLLPLGPRASLRCLSRAHPVFRLKL